MNLDVLFASKFQNFLLRHRHLPPRGQMPEDLDHPSGGLDVSPDFAKRLQPRFGDLEATRRHERRTVPEQRPTPRSLEEQVISKRPFGDPEALLYIRKDSVSFTLSCQFGP